MTYEHATRSQNGTRLYTTYQDRREFDFVICSFTLASVIMKCINRQSIGQATLTSDRTNTNKRLIHGNLQQRSSTSPDCTQTIRCVDIGRFISHST